MTARCRGAGAADEDRGALNHRHHAVMGIGGGTTIVEGTQALMVYEPLRVAVARGQPGGHRHLSGGPAMVGGTYAIMAPGWISCWQLHDAAARHVISTLLLTA